MVTTITQIPSKARPKSAMKQNGNASNMETNIHRHLPDADAAQVAQYAQLLKRLRSVKDFLNVYPEDKTGYEAFLARAEKALDYKRPYRIAIIGTTGVGKSTLINALLGRKLVVVKDVGKPATGAALEIFLDASQGEEEVARVTYRDEANILSLVAEFMARFDNDPAALPDSLDKKFVRELQNLQPGDQLGEQTQQEFEGLRDSLADIVNQYLTANPTTLLTEYKLSNPRHVEDLMSLTDENSSLNAGPGRCIGLARSVAYHIRPAKSQGALKTLELPHNVCLVDLPGLDGSPLHDIIISEGIKEADAVVFILRPPRILNRGDAYLLNRVRKYISLDGAVDAAERIFLVLNAVDDITRDDHKTLDNLPRDMRELMDLLSPGYAARFARRGGDQPYFMTSAWTAFNAQNALQGGVIEDPKTYHSKAVKLGADENDHAAMLAASRLPSLTDSLGDFAHTFRIEGQLREGRQALDRITKSLADTYDSEIKLLTNGQGIAFVKTEDARLLRERKENLSDIIVDFRLRQLDHLEDLRGELRSEAARICDTIDHRLSEELPRLWKRFYIADRYRPRARKYGKTMYEVFLGEVELLLWRQLSIRVQTLADRVTMNYKQAFESSHIPRYIVNLGYDHPLASSAAAGLEDVSSDMKASLNKLAERLALIYMLEPKAGFITPEQLQDNRLIVENPLIKALDTVPRQRELPAKSFAKFLQAVRKHYEAAVLDYSVNALLNIYQYEMLYVEDGLLARVDELFSDLRETLSLDPLLREKVRQDAPDEDRDRVESLDTRRVALARVLSADQ
ncbi:MAG TPA: hypothetical protein G4N96_00380 [Chloroflexi bacterium]|nr:hypothetical protein [Chloroflexota bacterium]